MLSKDNTVHDPAHGAHVHGGDPVPMTPVTPSTTVTMCTAAMPLFTQVRGETVWKL
jgi:hypothetical protein